MTKGSVVQVDSILGTVLVDLHHLLGAWRGSTNGSDIGLRVIGKKDITAGKLSYSRLIARSSPNASLSILMNTKSSGRSYLAANPFTSLAKIEASSTVHSCK